MENRGNKALVAVAVIVVAVLLFAGGYALGLLNGSSNAAGNQGAAQMASSAQSQEAGGAQAQAGSSADDAQSGQAALPSASSAHSDEDSSGAATGEDGQKASSTEDAYATSGQSPGSSSTPAAQAAGIQVDEDGTYTSKDEVALYIHTYGHLPSNYISKSKAKKAGWVSSKGNLNEVLPGMSIGGSEFYNYDGQLPDAPGRTWTECDINYEGGFRGAERIVFSDDGLIFYTADHYETFEQLY